MPNPHHGKEDAGGSRPLLRTKGAKPSVADKSVMRWPALPGSPRKIHKSLGRSVKNAIHRTY